MPSLENQLSDMGLRVVEMKGDGNCLFRALAHQILGDPDRHMEIRSAIVRHIQGRKEHFRAFSVDESIDSRLARMSRAGEWGDHLEIHAASELFSAKIEIFSGREKSIVVDATSGRAKRLLRIVRRSEHYDSVAEAKSPRRSVSQFLRDTFSRGSSRAKTDPQNLYQNQYPSLNQNRYETLRAPGLSPYPQHQNWTPLYAPYQPHSALYGQNWQGYPQPFGVRAGPLYPAGVQPQTYYHLA